MVSRNWLNALLVTAEQGLVDLIASGAADVVFVRESRAPASAFFEPLALRAHAMGLVTSSFSIGEDQGFEALDEVVRGFVKHLTPGEGTKGATGKKGLVALLDAFVETHKKKSLDRFDEASGEAGFFGDLHRIARAYIAAAREPRDELRVLRAWLDGTELQRSPVDEPLSALSARTAKRALADLSRLVIALGHGGLVLIARRADHLTRLTPVRREMAYTVLRELIDNADSSRGLTSTRLYVSGDDALLDGTRGISVDGALATRVLVNERSARGDESVPLVPHATVITLVPPEGVDIGSLAIPREATAPSARKTRAVRGLVRACQGLPPLDLAQDITVGYDAIDVSLDALFQHTSNAGSVFTLVAGDYGSGKTHLLLHAEARALGDKRPVLRLAVERLDTDLGNPQRHLSRLLEHARLPLPGTPGPLDRLAFWLRTEASSKRFAKTIDEIAASEGDAATAARKVARALESETPRAVFACLAATDLVTKSNNASYRLDAYARLLLWLELLERLEGFAGPLVVIDEAENLYRGGTSRAERRTALRSLAFYCGGTLPRACVILAVTPETLELLREESAELLDEVSEQRTLLSCEDGTMLRRRLSRSRPLEVVKLSKDDLGVLAEKIRDVHASVRGSVRDAEWESFVARATTGRPTPRALIREVMTHLESAWWTG